MRGCYRRQEAFGDGGRQLGGRGAACDPTGVAVSHALHENTCHVDATPLLSFVSFSEHFSDYVDTARLPILFKIARTLHLVKV